MRWLVLFDIDGTLILTGGAGVRAMTQTFEEAFAATDAFRGLPVAGRTDQAILYDAVTRLGIALETDWLDRFRERYHELLRREILQPGPRKGVMPGVPTLLRALRAREDVTLALLTGNFAEAARIKLEHFELWHYFTTGAYGDDAADRNALVAVALDRVRHAAGSTFEPASVLVVGDTPFDVECARAAGARAVGVATGDFDEAALRAAGADIVLPDFSDPEGFLRLLRFGGPGE